MVALDEASERSALFFKNDKTVIRNRLSGTDADVT